MTVTVDTQTYARPKSRLYRAEPARAAIELSRFWAAYPVLLGPSGGPPGDGQGVLVLPGFMASDASTHALRRLLVDRGYPAQPWGLGRNLGPTAKVLAGLDGALADLYSHTGRPVSVVGWSLGGIFARGLAARHPEQVRSVITIASPLRVTAHADHKEMTNAGRLFYALRRLHSDESWLPEAVLHAPPPVPTTAIYSTTDGIVPWQSCLEFEGPRTESIMVNGSHCGLGHNVAAMPIVLDRLALPEGEWAPYGG
jgi:alpha/beta hydrolase fold